MIAADWVAGLPLNKYAIMVIISLIYQNAGGLSSTIWPS